MRVYFFYIKKDLLPEDITFTMRSDFFRNTQDRNYVLYAITNNKDYKDKFLIERSKEFIKTKHKVDIEEFEKMKKDLKGYFLDYRDYKYDDGSVKILSTKFEYNAVLYEWFEFNNLYDNLGLFSYQILHSLKDEYYFALHRLGLISLYVCSHSPEYAEWYFDEIMFEDNHLKSLYHLFLPDQKIEISIKLRPNEFNLFISAFRSLFKE